MSQFLHPGQHKPTYAGIHMKRKMITPGYFSNDWYWVHCTMRIAWGRGNYKDSVLSDEFFQGLSNNNLVVIHRCFSKMHSKQLRRFIKSRVYGRRGDDFRVNDTRLKFTCTL